jgi:enamine deaminase RidA (YjgF/YER057c/UK114 family)
MARPSPRLEPVNRARPPRPAGARRGAAPTAEQFAAAVRNVARALAAAGAAPEHVLSIMIYVTDMDEYLAELKPIGAAYREVFGDHYPPMALLGVARLLDPAAKVELVATAVVPDGEAPTGRH